MENPDRIILEQAKKEKNIIYGARSIQKQIGIFSRGTKDWDILSNKPRRSATRTENKMDKISGGDYYYIKPAIHPGTWKVMSKGYDSNKGTKDDFGIVDYTVTPKPRPKVTIINGVMYRKLSEERNAKMRSLRDKTQKFRWKKDREDIERIKLASKKQLYLNRRNY